MAKLINDLMSGFSDTSYVLHNTDHVDVSGLSIDSRKVQAGDLFFAMQGQQYDAAEFVTQAIKNGARAICCDQSSQTDVAAVLPANFPLVVVTALSEKLSQIANIFYSMPSHGMHITAITGTDGKTSVSHFAAQLLDDAAVVGTMGNGQLSHLQDASHTTPNAIELQALMQQFSLSGIKAVAMEASSHGLSQGRLSAVDINTAVLTNFSRDHLDYHGSLAAYKAAKKILFTEFDVENIIVNYNDDFGKEIYQEFKTHKQKKLIAYSTDSKDDIDYLLNAEVVRTLSDGFQLKVQYADQQQQLRLQLLGRFNIENAMAVLAILITSGMSFEQACTRLETLRAITGRMQSIQVDHKAHVVIDYAHTPQALALALQALKDHSIGNIICVFGCGGDRDQGKRPLMAQAACQANYVFVTNDNPRTESPAAIIENICTGFVDFSDYEIEYDRSKAIRMAIDKAESDDVVLIAGKGHEQYQIIGTEKQAYSDEAVVRNYLKVAA